MNAIRIGLENLIDSHRDLVTGQRLGLVMNQASVDSKLRYACDVIAEAFPNQLTTLFSPQHGFWGEQQANMIESPNAVYKPLGLPVVSLYSDTRRPSKESLQNVDTLLIDLQDVGTRVYTFIWTMLECMKAAAEFQRRVIILDRPNPIGGVVVEGPLIASGFESFVGNAAIPMRHGLTIGELARLLNAELGVGCDVHVVPITGWIRSMLWPQTERSWVLPSPNMPDFETSVVYPGQVMLEGTNLSEGRGTTLPFRIFGAPWLDPEELLQSLDRSGVTFPGLKLQPIRFRPTFDKYQGETCGGLLIHVTDADSVRSFRLTLQMLNAIRHLPGSQLKWLSPPYEYEYVRPPIDILFGSDLLRRMLDQDSSLDICELSFLGELDAAAWWDRARPWLLY